jgi:hypothetical protein
MELIYVDSSNVEQIGYNAEWGELHVIFKTGRRYVYSDVPAEVWDEFLIAPSKGIFLNTVIKKGGYSYREE